MSAVHGDCSWCKIEAYIRDQAWQNDLPVLAQNLALGGGLCQAFALGTWDAVLGGTGWKPGCGKEFSVPETLDSEQRIREKQASRDEDQRRLDAGEITREGLRKENAAFAFPAGSVRLDLARARKKF